MNNKKHEITIAAIQMESFHGMIRENQIRATKLIEEAANRGAELIVLPELFSCGYISNPDIWRYGESQDSPTIQWLVETSKRLGIYLGAGLVEIIGNDFVNEFVLANPKGEIEGRAQKKNAEAYCFRRGKGVHIIHSSLAKIGVGICADNHFSDFIGHMRENDVDILLMPHAWPSPSTVSKIVSTEDIQKEEEEIKTFASLITSLLGVPSVFVNQIGKIAPMAGIFGGVMNPDSFRLHGFSRIVDAPGRTKAELMNQEGIAIATVTLDPSCKKNIAIPNFDGWIHPGSTIVRKIIIPIDTLFGSIYYRLSVKRKIEAKRRRVVSSFYAKGSL
ncbi:MAG TPA: carbon-nitrogen hydrolase family protein [Bacillota bacterium]